MSASRRYASPAAFRHALTDRLNAAAQSGPWTPQQLQRQVAYDRLLERLYLLDDDWIVKGATALLARNLGVRGTLDIDLYRETTRDAAEADVRRAAAADIGDWFTFEAGYGAPISNEATRLPVTALIGATTWIRFHLDLVGTAVRMTGQPEDVPPLARGMIPEVTQRGYRAYPLVDHIADKIAATYERYGTGRMPSTRYRDLVDLVAIITGGSVEAAAQRVALESEFTRRGLVLPDHFDIPDRALWTPGYAAEARRSLLDTARTLREALELVGPFADPLLQGTAAGTWRRTSQTWT
jgi:Nucleotidyl transferase AbiEii toxin, Type IV TA system